MASAASEPIFRGAQRAKLFKQQVGARTQRGVPGKRQLELTAHTATTGLLLRR